MANEMANEAKMVKSHMKECARVSVHNALAGLDESEPGGFTDEGKVIFLQELQLEARRMAAEYERGAKAAKAAR